jgi:hypothetical protein
MTSHGDRTRDIRSFTQASCDLTRPSSLRLRLDSVGLAGIGVDPCLPWKPNHARVPPTWMHRNCIWVTPGWRKTRSTQADPREKEISSPEAGNWRRFFSRLARVAPQATPPPPQLPTATPPPGLPARNHHRLRLIQVRGLRLLLGLILTSIPFSSLFPLLGFGYTAAAAAGFLPASRETVVALGPEVRISPSQFPSSSLVFLTLQQWMDI